MTMVYRREDGLQVAFERAAFGIAHVGLDGTFLDVNPFLCKLVGFSRDELLRRTFGDITHPDDLGADWESADALARGEIDSYTMEKRYIHREGRIVWINLLGSVVRNLQGEPKYYIAIVEDISRRKDAERANLAKSEFLATISHELRTPLAGIRGMADLLRGGDFGEVTGEQRDAIGDIVDSADHLLLLINDILDLAKVEAGKWDIEPEWIDPNELIVEVCDSLRSMVAQRQLRLSQALDVRAKPMFSDPRVFKQILYNYLSNAIKFTPSGGKVHVALRKEGNECVRLEVADTGPGIRSEDIPLLFNRFVQVGTSNQRGTGLGLSLVKRLAALQRGQVGVTSALGKGSTFWVVFPMSVIRPPDLESIDHALGRDHT